VYFQILQKWSGTRPSVDFEARAKLRIGIPKALNLWSTHQFWVGFMEALGINPRKLAFSSDTSEEQGGEFGKGRGIVNYCYPVKCISGHFGELLLREKRKIDILFYPMIHSLPSVLNGYVVDSLSCPRVSAASENIRAGFVEENDSFADLGIRYVSPFVSLGEPALVPRQLYAGLQDVIVDLTLTETRQAVDAGYKALEDFNAEMRRRSLEVLQQCVAGGKPCLLVLARPYHMDPGIGHEIEGELQACGYPVLWVQYLPTDPELLEWVFRYDLDSGLINSPFDIADVWPSSYSANTNEILWGAKVAARMPWIAAVIRLSSYECGMDRPTYSLVQQIVERSGTLFFSFQNLDSTRPAVSVKSRVETIAYYLQKCSASIIERKQQVSAPDCPLLNPEPEALERACVEN